MLRDLAPLSNRGDAGEFYFIVEWRKGESYFSIENPSNSRRNVVKFVDMEKLRKHRERIQTTKFSTLFEFCISEKRY